MAPSLKPHIVILPSPGMGNFTPLWEFAKRLVIHHDFHVTFLVITTGSSPAQNHFIQSTTLPSTDLHVIHLPPVDMSPIFTDNMPVLTRLCLIIQQSLLSLRDVLLGLTRPDALVIDIFCTQAFRVCKDLPIPVYSFFTASTALLAFSLYLPTLDREVDGEFVDLPDPIHVPGCNSILSDDLLDQVKNRKSDDYKWYLLHVSRLNMAAGILVNTWEDFEPVWLPGLKKDPFYKNNNPIPPVHAIGPLIKEDEPGDESDETIKKWLDDQPSDSVLLVSLGSAGTLTSDQLTELALGLELSQQRFIFVVREPTDASASAAFFNVGDDAVDPVSYLPKGFKERTKGVGVVVGSWGSQVAVLRHKATGGFLSHCGWNSTLESMVHGVPMIAWPLYAEQKMNATVLTEEVGVAVKPVAREGENVIRREEVERVVRLVMEGEEGKVMRRKAKQLEASAIITLKDGGSSHDSLSRVLELWKS